MTILDLNKVYGIEFWCWEYCFAARSVYTSKRAYQIVWYLKNVIWFKHCSLIHSFVFTRFEWIWKGKWIIKMRKVIYSLNTSNDWHTCIPSCLHEYVLQTKISFRQSTENDFEPTMNCIMSVLSNTMSTCLPLSISLVLEDVQLCTVSIFVFLLCFYKGNFGESINEIKNKMHYLLYYNKSKQIKW